MQKTTARDFDFEKTQQSYWAANAWWMAPLTVFVLTVVLTVLSFPPAKTPEFAYVFAAPAVFWALTQPRFKVFVITILSAQVVAWTILLSWLHHVTWGGLFLLGPFVGIWIGSWYLALWWAARKIMGKPLFMRAALMLGLAALWVVIEWTRTWFLGGFPWLPLGASQWQRVVMLQIASYTGQGGIAFVLITFNFGFGAYMHRLFREKELRGLRKRSPEFSIALLVLLFAVLPLLREVVNQQREPYARVALVQPHIPQSVKWNPANADMSYTELAKLSMSAARLVPEVIIWPEAAIPYALEGWPESPKIQEWLNEIAQRVKAPIVTGAVLSENPARPDDTFFNAAYVVDSANGGLQPGHYAKRHLVPFGEYMPLRPLLGWLQKITDASAGDTQAGTHATPLLVKTPRATLAVGMLICYEDIFPKLAAANVYAGAQAHVVVTNNGWFGEGGAAYQHAAHSVLRAVETRRPVIRCGNSGWSGWIDEYGNIRGVMKNKDGSIYYRGTQIFEVTRDKNWVGHDSFYVLHGDWFIVLSAALALFGYAMGQFYKPRDTAPLAEN